MSDLPVRETAITAAVNAGAEAVAWLRHGLNAAPDDADRRISTAVTAAAAPLIDAAARASERETIRQLHRPVSRGRVMNCCEGCEYVNGEFHDDCCHEWPCPTIELLDGTP